MPTEALRGWDKMLWLEYEMALPEKMVLCGEVLGESGGQAGGSW